MMLPEPRVSGLATIALLKAQYDERHDHIDMFQPFIDDVVATATRDDLELEDVRRRIENEHGLKIPLATLSTLLGRAARRGVVRREGGRYFRRQVPPTGGNLSAARHRIEREHTWLAQRLTQFAETYDRHLDEDEALHLLMTFLSSNHTEILLDEYASEHAHPATGLGRRDTRLIARFIEQVCFKEPTLQVYLERIVEGFVLQNALLLRDIAHARRQFNGLQAFFDSGFLFGLVGLKGAPTQIAYAEITEILRATNVRLRAFDKTVYEMKRILAVYEHHLATAEGRRALFPSDLTRHFLTHHYTPSDVRQAMALLPQDLQRAGVSVVGLPKRDKRYTLDEEALANAIKHPQATEINTRVLHDVDCVAGVLVVRADTTPPTWEDARAAFVTTSGLLVKNTAAWYEGCDGEGLPPAIHVLALSNLAWLKKPAAAQRLKVHELVALCEAALRPSREMWTRFLAHLRRLEQEGRVTSDEAVAVLASDLTDQLLSNLDDEGDVEAESVSEIVERVKQVYREDADTRVAAAEKRTAEIAEDHRRLQLRLTVTAHWAARSVSYVIFGVVSFLVGYALLFAIPGLADRLILAGRGTLVAGSAGAVLFVVSYASLLFGHHLSRWRLSVESAVAVVLRRLLLGGDLEARANPR